MIASCEGYHEAVCALFLGYLCFLGCGLKLPPCANDYIVVFKGTAMFIQCLCSSVSTTTCLGYWNIGCYHILARFLRVPHSSRRALESQNARERFSNEGLGKYSWIWLLFALLFLPVESREDEPGSHGSAISASISSHAEPRFYQRFKLGEDIHVRGNLKLKVVQCFSSLCNHAGLFL